MHLPEWPLSAFVKLHMKQWKQIKTKVYSDEMRSWPVESGAGWSNSQSGVLGPDTRKGLCLPVCSIARDFGKGRF